MRKKSGIRRLFENTFLRVPLALYLVTIILPFMFLILNSFKTNKEFYSNFWQLPEKIQWQNYSNAVERTGLGHMFLNTIVIVTVALIINVVLSSMIAYIIARCKTRYGERMFKFFLFGMLVPTVVTVIPVFLIGRITNLYDTRILLILVYASIELPFAVFVFSAYYKTVPKALEEAARIDGASRYQTFWKVIFPISKASILTVIVFNFIEFWNDYLMAMTLISTQAKKTLSLGVMKLNTANNVKTEWGQLFAVCVLVMIPVLILYIVFQKKFTQGLTEGAVKG